MGEDFLRELKERHIWLIWVWEFKEDGKKTKVPRSADNCGATGTDNKWSHSWVTYNEAIAAKEKFDAAGVGFVIPKGYFFLDIDHYALTDPFVQILLERFNSYAEHSVSGGGIHIYGKCDFEKLPTFKDKNGNRRLDKAYYMKNPNNHLELYIGGLTNRFAVFTGDVVLDEPLKESTAAVLLTLERNMRKAEKVKYSEKRDGDREIFDIVCNLRKQKNGDKFRKFYDDGDITGYGSQSEADAALCALIAFRTGPDPAAIDEIFRTSALYREKWEREDYSESTINAGIEACHGKFHRSKMDHPYFVKFDENGSPYVFAPLLAKWTREHLNYILVRDNGKQALLIYVYEDGCYRLYAPDMLKGLIKVYIAEYDEELVTMGKVTEAYNQITTDLNYISQDDLNSNEDFINFKNGLLKVTKDTIELIPHTPEVLSSIQIPCEWKGTPKPTPVFDSYMHTLTNGDKTVEGLLLEFIGACISNIKGWRMKKSLFLVGDGDTGKSQLKSLVERLLGKGNFIGIDLKDIEARFGTGVIYNTRLAGSSDMSFLSVDELKTFKKITGGDSVFAEFKGMQGFEYTYNGLLWFCMNKLPKFGGDDGQWVYDRIMVVHCPNVIPISKQDKQLQDKMFAEREGIVYKAVKALQRVIANGYRFSEPASVSAARKEYRKTNSTVISFFEDCMVARQNGKISDSCTTGRVYKVYRIWCANNNNGYAKTAKEFRDELSAHLSTTFTNMSVQRNSGTYYRDYTLSLETKREYSQIYGYDSTEFLG
jgi:putative DNA primase/helicase